MQNIFYKVNLNSLYKQILFNLQLWILGIIIIVVRQVLRQLTITLFWQEKYFQLHLQI